MSAVGIRHSALSIEQRKQIIKEIKSEKESMSVNRGIINVRVPCYNVINSTDHCFFIIHVKGAREK